MIIDSKNVAEYGIKIACNDDGLKYGFDHINKYAEKCVGIKFSLYTNQKHFISIGKNEFSEDIINSNPIPFDKYDGYRIMFSDGNIYIFGSEIRSTTYGVYAFIEKFLGVRWFHKNAELTPKSDAIEIAEKDIFEWSYFPLRELTYLPFTTDWELSMHFRFVSHNLMENKTLGQVNTWYKKIPTTHNTHCYVDFNKIKDHPEFFCKKLNDISITDIFNNGPGSSNIDLCFSNGITEDGNFDESVKESAAREVANKLYEFICEEPDKKYFMFGQQDNRAIACHCDRCEKKRKELGAESANEIIFLNAVIKKVESMLRENNKPVDFNVIMFAYHTTEEPPVDKNGNPTSPLVIPCDRLHVRFAPIDANYTYFLGDDRQPESVKRQFRGWSKLTKNLMIWDYNINYMDSNWFFPILPVLQKNIKYYSEIKSSYIFNEGCDSGNNNWQNELNSYVASKLYWNYDIDLWGTVKEYVYGFYGIAGEKVYKYIKTMYAYYDKKVKEGLEITILDAYGEIFNPANYPVEFLMEQYNLIKSCIQDIKNSSLDKMQKKEYIIRVKRVLSTTLRMMVKNSDYYFKDDTTFVDELALLAIELHLDSLNGGPVEFVLSDNYTSKFKVVLSQHPTEEEKRCAEKFIDRFEKLSGIRLPLVDDSKVAPSYVTKSICIGRNVMFREFFKGKVDISKYKYFIATLGNSLFILSDYDLEKAIDYSFIGMQSKSIGHLGFGKVTCPSRRDFELI